SGATATSSRPASASARQPPRSGQTISRTAAAKAPRSMPSISPSSQPGRRCSTPGCSAARHEVTSWRTVSSGSYSPSGPRSANRSACRYSETSTGGRRTVSTPRSSPTSSGPTLSWYARSPSLKAPRPFSPSRPAQPHGDRSGAGCSAREALRLKDQTITPMTARPPANAIHTMHALCLHQTLGDQERSVGKPHISGNSPVLNGRRPQPHHVLHQGDQRALDRLPVPRVRTDDRHLRGERHRLADLGVGVLELPVPPVDRDDERQPRLFEVVDGRKAVGQPPRVDQHHRADGAAHQVVPHEPEPVLAGRAEQVEDQVAVERHPAEVHRDRGGLLVRGEADVV